MALFRDTFNTFEDLYHDQLQDLFDAEQRLCKALPEMQEAAHCPELKQAFQTHLDETNGQVERLERCFSLFNQPAKAKTCEAMKGLISEGSDVIGAKGDPDVKDAALIAAAQRIEHYEMAGYGCLRTFALRIGQDEAAGILQETLEEEEHADKVLTEIAENHVNIHAVA